ncbi:hypothetical protein ACI8AG_09590 [Blastococcus sp. SYSU DS0552]
MTATTTTDPAVRRLAIYRLAAALALEDLPERVIVQALAFEPAAERMSTDELRDVTRRVCAERRRRAAEAEAENSAVAS